MNFDKVIFDQIANPIDKNAKPPFYGQLFIQNIDYTATFTPPLKLNAMYEIFILANTTSQAAAGTWGAFTHELILEDYLR